MILLNPGPVNVSDRVRQAAAMEPICHREPEYFDMQDEVRARLLELFDLPKSEFAVGLIAGSGTSAVEAMVCAGVPAGKRLVVVSNGVYGDRIARMAEAHGIPCDEVRFPWEQAADPERVDERVRAIESAGGKIGALAVIHHETTTGLVNPIPELAAIARRAGARFLVDSVSGLAGDPIDVAATDFCAGTAGKCLQGLPGVSFVFARRECLRAAGPRRSVYLDLADLCARQDVRGTPFTPAVPIVNAFREALRETAEEGVAARIARYGRAAAFLRAGYARMGLAAWLPHDRRSNCLTTLRLPPGRTYADLHDTLKREGFVIYAGQGNLEREAFRICNMGWIPEAEFARLLAVLERWVRPGA
ncbi:MAG: aminotransferase class V-fold PLP-dependent enzyme [Planctomycetes bacterium]|nr:aminotransferase class V-fold PLP-dependent enzyme [Planctomycetota bacterium]